MNKLIYDQSVITKEKLESLRHEGFSQPKIAEYFGVSVYTVKRAMIDYGIITPTPKKKFLDVSPGYVEARADEFAHFLDLHNQGMTFAEIAKSCGRSMSYVGRLFTLNGISFDSAHKTEAAHKAVKGKTRTLDDLERRARGKERKPPAPSRWERLFAAWLDSQRINYVASKAIGKYNVDFAIGDSVAVELYGGAFHAQGRAAARLNDRMAYLLNEGWNVYIIWCLSKETTIFSSCLDDFIIFLQKASCDETFRSQYRVIWSDGDFVSAGSFQRDYLAAVIPARMRHDALRKYKSARD